MTALELKNNLNTLANDVKNEYVKLTDDLSNIDREICDIYHYIEFYNLNAAEGFKVYKMLQDCLKKRREIKNDLALITVIKSVSMVDIINETTKCCNRIDNQVYTPRVRTDLFEKKTNAAAIFNNNIESTTQITSITAVNTKKAEKFTFSSIVDAAKFLYEKNPGSWSKETAIERISKRIKKAHLTNGKYCTYYWHIE